MVLSESDKELNALVRTVAAGVDFVAAQNDETAATTHPTDKNGKRVA